TVLNRYRMTYVYSRSLSIRAVILFTVWYLLLLVFQICCSRIFTLGSLWTTSVGWITCTTGVIWTLGLGIIALFDQLGFTRSFAFSSSGVSTSHAIHDILGTTASRVHGAAL